MFQKLRQSLSGYSRVAGIELVLKQDESPGIYLVILSLKNNILSIEKKVSGLKSLNEIKTEITNDIPVSLIINGKGILHKKVTISETNHNQLIQQVLPNAKAADFYIQFHNSENDVFISLVRKNLLDPLFKELKKNNFFLISLSIGPFPVINILPLLGDVSETLSYSGHNLSFHKDLLKEYKFLESPEYNNAFLIDKEPLEEIYLNSYSAAFQSLYSQSSVIEINDEFFIHEKEEFTYKTIFKKLGIIFLALVLIILMGNVFLFQKYFEENQVLTAKESHYNGQLLKLDSLEKSIKEKEKFFSEGWKGNSRISYYLDKLAATLPASMRLEVLSVSPFNEKVYKTDRKLEFAINIMSIIGICKKPTDLNSWIKDLKEMEFIRDVKIQSYSFDNKEKEGKFHLEIYLK